MAVSSALRRLLHVREIAEEQQRLALEFALGELHTLETALAGAHARARQGKAGLAASLSSGEIADRTAALVEIEAARRRAAVLQSRIAAVETAAARARQEYLARRVERRQAQTLIEQARVQESVESNRRSQQTLDESFASRRHMQRSEAARDEDQR